MTHHVEESFARTSWRSCSSTCDCETGADTRACRPERPSRSLWGATAPSCIYPRVFLSDDESSCTPASDPSPPDCPRSWSTGKSQTKNWLTIPETELACEWKLISLLPRRGENPEDSANPRLRGITRGEIIYGSHKSRASTFAKLSRLFGPERNISVPRCSSRRVEDEK